MELLKTGLGDFNVDVNKFWLPLELPYEPKAVGNINTQTWAKKVGVHKIVAATDEMLNSKRTQRGD